MRSSSVSPMPTRMPLVNGIRSSPAASIVASRRAGCLVGRARVHRVHQALGHRLQHQTHRRVHLAQPREVVAVEHAEVRVRQQPPLERALARPDHIGGEVIVAVSGKPARDLVVHLRTLAREDQQLLASPAGGVVEHPLDLVGRVQVRPVCRKRAVLAVALTGARQRERVVAREGDASHGRRESSGPLVPPPRRPAMPHERAYGAHVASSWWGSYERGGPWAASFTKRLRLSAPTGAGSGPGPWARPRASPGGRAGPRRTGTSTSARPARRRRSARRCTAVACSTRRTPAPGRTNAPG